MLRNTALFRIADDVRCAPGRSRIPRWRAVLVVALALALPHPVAAMQEQVLDVTCREVRSLDALQYWFWDGYSGLTDVHDFAYERWGRIAIDPSICFRIALVVIDDPQQRSAGYRQAVAELIKWVTENENVDEENSELARSQLERLTAEDFDSVEDWSAWWERSRDFMTWSEDDGHLVVLTEARDAGEAVHDDAMQLDAEEYWFYTARGWISGTAPVGEYVFGTVSIPPHDFNFRAVSDALEDRRAKERGYRRALASMFIDGVESSRLAGDNLASLLEQISTLTGQRLDGRDAWLSWWNEYGDDLVLSADGTRLVVRR